MKHRFLNILVLLLAVLLSACAGKPPQTDEPKELAVLLASHERFSAFSQEEQRRELAALLAAHERAPSDQTRLQLALMYLFPRAPWRDDKRAQALLSEIEMPPPGQHSVRRDMAQLLLRFVAERQRIERDDQRKIDTLGQQLRDERRKLEDGKQSSEEARRKLESLRAIDRELGLRKREP